MPTTVPSRTPGLIRFLTNLLLAGSTALLIGCAADSGPVGIEGEDSGRGDGEPEETAVHEFFIYNHSSETITEVYLSFCSASDWGSNDLPAGETIDPDQVASWQFSTSDCLDVRVVTNRGNTATEYGIQLDGEFHWEVTGGGSGDGTDDGDYGSTGYGVTINNYTNEAISEVYFSHCTDNSWGPNQLSGTIAPDQSHQWSLSEGGCYNFKAVTTGGGESINRGVDITGYFIWSVRP